MARRPQRQDAQETVVIDFAKYYKPSIQQMRAHQCPSTYILFGGAMGGGKMSPVWGIVMTPFGPKKMGDIKVGSLVSNPDGTNSVVIGVWPQGIKPVYRVSFSDGSSTLVGGDHLWLARRAMAKSKRNSQLLADNGNILIKKPRIYTTMQLKEHLDKASERTEKRCPLIPLTEPVQFTVGYRNKEASLPIEPYLLGVLLGDGCISYGMVEVTIGEIKLPIVDKIRTLGYKNLEIKPVKDRATYRITFGSDTGRIMKGLFSLGLLDKVSNTKFIPNAYMIASLDDRWELVRGLMDTDGTISANGLRCSWASVSKEMAEQFRWILMSLGFRANTAVKRAWYYDENKERVKCKDAYIIDPIQGRYRNQLFSLPFKSDRVCMRYNGQSLDDNPVLRRMVSIEPEGEEECQCITVDNVNGLYLTDDFIVTHNSYWLCAEAIQRSLDYDGNIGFLCRKENATFKRTTLVTLRSILPPEAVFKHNKTEQFYELINGSIIYYGGLKSTDTSQAAEDRIKSMTLGWFGIDEASEVPEDLFLMLCSRLRHQVGLRGTIQYKGLLTSNPEPGWLLRRFIETQNPDHAYIPSTVKDNPYLPEGYEENLRQMFPPDQVKAYVDGDWYALLGLGERNVFPYGWVRVATNAFFEKGFTPVEMGVDPGRGGDESVIFLRQGVKATMLFAGRMKDTAQFADIVIEQAGNHEPETIKIDVSGLGGGIYDNLLRHTKIKNIIREYNGGWSAVDDERFARLRSETHWEMRKRFEEGRISIPDDAKLLAELISMRYTVKADRRIYVETKEEMLKRGVKSPNRADALMYAFAEGRVIVPPQVYIW